LGVIVEFARFNDLRVVVDETKGNRVTITIHRAGGKCTGQFCEVVEASVLAHDCILLSINTDSVMQWWIVFIETILDIELEYIGGELV